MADTTVPLKAIATVMRDEIVESIYQGAPELRLINLVKGGGPNVAWAVSTDGYSNGASTFSEGDDLNYFSASTDMQPVLQWARYFESKRLTGSLLDQAGSAMNPLGSRPQLLRAMKACARNLAEKIALEMYVGLGVTDHLCGFDVAFDDDNEYAGIDRHTTSNHPFDSNVFDPGTPTALTELQMITDINAITKRKGRKPSFALTSFEVVAKAAALLSSLRNYILPVQTPSGLLQFQGGYDAIVIHGVPLIASRNVPDSGSTAHNIYYVQRDEVELVCLDMSSRVAAGLGVMAEGEDSDGAIGLPLLWQTLATLGDSLPVACKSELQLRVLDPASCGVRRNINPT